MLNIVYTYILMYIVIILYNHILIYNHLTFMYRCKLWIYNIRRNDLEKRVKKEGYGFLKNMRLCSSHFDADQYRNLGGFVIKI